jgi:hypothetical protein
MFLCFQGASRLVRALRGKHQRPSSPLLREGMKLEIVASGQVYQTALHAIEGDVLWLLPPLRLGLPLSFAPQTPVELCICVSGGQFTALTPLIGRRTQPQSLIGFRLPRQWCCNQRRRHERMKLSSERLVDVLMGERVLMGWLQDLSAGGARLYLRNPVPVPGLIHLRLNEDDPAISAQIVTCERALYHHRYEYALRVRFQEPQTSVLCTPPSTSR